MSVLDHLAQAAAVLLLLELLVVLLIFLGISGGLAFGLHWVRGKTDWAFDKANAFLPRITQYTHQGTGYVAKPFILAHKFGATTAGTADAIRNAVRGVHAATEPVAARPVPRPEPVTEPIEPVNVP